MEFSLWMWASPWVIMATSAFPPAVHTRPSSWRRPQRLCCSVLSELPGRERPDNSALILIISVDAAFHRRDPHLRTLDISKQPSGMGSSLVWGAEGLYGKEGFPGVKGMLSSYDIREIPLASCQLAFYNPLPDLPDLRLTRDSS